MKERAEEGRKDVEQGEGEGGGGETRGWRRRAGLLAVKQRHV